MCLNVVLGQLGKFHERAKKADFQRLGAVDGNDDSFRTAFLEEYMMTALGAGKLPSPTLNGTSKVLPGNLLQMANSKI